MSSFYCEGYCLMRPPGRLASLKISICFKGFVRVNIELITITESIVVCVRIRKDQFLLVIRWHQQGPSPSVSTLVVTSPRTSFSVSLHPVEKQINKSTIAKLLARLCNVLAGYNLSYWSFFTYYLYCYHVYLMIWGTCRKSNN